MTDMDGIKLQNLIRRRRRELGISPSWRAVLARRMLAVLTVVGRVTGGMFV
ncbi:MAG: hypothetical protein M0Z50_11470 [Planctomycetia bacterium]|nr:hypothetical protein [Planctomycetia bacterium]